MRLKKFSAVVLIFALVLSQSIASYAWPKIPKIPKINLKNKVEDLGKKVAKEAEKTGKKVVKETGKVGKKVGKELEKQVNNVLKNNPQLSELDLLPVLTIDLNTMTNIQTVNTGAYK